MKDYNEMSKNVLNRRDKYAAERSRQIKKITSALSCFCLTALLGVGVCCWYSTITSNHNEAKAGGIMYDKATTSDFSDSADAHKENMQHSEPQLKPNDKEDMQQFGQSMISIGDSKKEAPPVRDMISSYDPHAPNESPACYPAAENGTVIYSLCLSSAMKEYTDSVLYRVFVDLYKDGTELPANGEDAQREMARLGECGYTVAYEQYFDGFDTHHYFTLHATFDQLNTFAADSGYGYILHLYEERVTLRARDININIDIPVQGEPGNTGALNKAEEFWGGSYMDEDGHWVIWLTSDTAENREKVFQMNPTLLESNTTFKTADYSLDYLTNLMAEISKAMGSKELSFISTAALREERNRVEVTMTTDDADSVAKVLVFDTIGGAIEIKYASEYITNEAIIKDPAR